MQTEEQKTGEALEQGLRSMVNNVSKHCNAALDSDKESENEDPVGTSEGVKE